MSKIGLSPFFFWYAFVCTCLQHKMAFKRSAVRSRLSPPQSTNRKIGAFSLFWRIFLKVLQCSLLFPIGPDKAYCWMLPVLRSRYRPFLLHFIGFHPLKTAAASQPDCRLRQAAASGQLRFRCDGKHSWRRSACRSRFQRHPESPVDTLS